ncbi:hypothetical protein [Streptomyces sp. NK08204]|uniref:hypothetical protein n=1 Tax=Streptomyces sp. NK08204 TaxID=2873260 RepID=UPI001CED01DC|nr:hypothetical protein [Streptomyces sp. NK08204]
MPAADGDSAEYGGEYAGMDALLKEELTWLAEALTGELQESAPEESESLEPAASARSTASPRSLGPGTRPRGSTRPVSPARPPRPGRPAGPRRVLRIALGALAGAAALTMAVGLGWVASRGDGAKARSADESAKSAAHAPAEYSWDGGRPDDPELALACFRLVVEGTVTKVEPEHPSPRARIVLTVSRSYKPAHTPPEVVVRLDAGARPVPLVGQHVLVGVPQDAQNASLWAVGDDRVDVNRAWITEALPGSRHHLCGEHGEYGEHGEHGDHGERGDGEGGERGDQ